MILVFAGAGASKAVDAKQYPTTVEFFRSLPDTVTKQPLFAELASFLQAKLQSEQLDIEQWLWAASEVRAIFTSLNENSHPAGWLLEGNRISGVLGGSADVRPALSVTGSARKALERLEDAVNRQIYELYRPEPAAEDLDRTWIPLLSGLLSRETRVEICTTNYDIVLEEAIALGNLPIETGRRRGTYSRITESTWIEADSEKTSSRGLLTKLHGSVDWCRIGNEIHYGTPRFQGNHDDQVILYPGYKGVPERRPFTVFHEHFGRVVQNATVGIFVGFAFRDQYINQILRDRFPSNGQAIIVNPAELTALPFRNGQARHLREPFNEKSINEVLKAAFLRANVPGS
jgi:hypothetical protein